MSYLDNKSAMRQYALKPAVAAGIVAAGSALWNPGSTVTLIGGRTLPLPLVAAGITFLAAEAVALIEDKLMDHVPVINMMQAPAHAALNVAAYTGASAAIGEMAAPGLTSDLGIPQLLAFGLLAEVGSTYITDDLITPMYNQWTAKY